MRTHLSVNRTQETWCGDDWKKDGHALGTSGADCPDCFDAVVTRLSALEGMAGALERIIKDCGPYRYETGAIARFYLQHAVHLAEAQLAVCRSVVNS